MSVSCPLPLITIFSELHYIYDHGTRQHVSKIVHHKPVRTDYGKANIVKQMLQYAECVAWECISNKIRMLPLHVFSYHVKSHLVAVY